MSENYINGARIRFESWFFYSTFRVFELTGLVHYKGYSLVLNRVPLEHSATTAVWQILIQCYIVP